MVSSSHAWQSSNHACFDGNYRPPGLGSRYYGALWRMSVVHPVVLVDAKAISRIQFDHMSIDWRDVIRTKIDVQPRSLPATSAQISEPKMDAVGNPKLCFVYLYEAGGGRSFPCLEESG
jgi:hypothetical protein